MNKEKLCIAIKSGPASPRHDGRGPFTLCNYVFMFEPIGIKGADVLTQRIPKNATFLEINSTNALLSKIIYFY